jgi:hypothetical protein
MISYRAQGSDATSPPWKQLELLAVKVFESQRDETAINVQFVLGAPFIVRGFDTLSFKVEADGSVGLFLGEVKDYASEVPTEKFSAFGVNRASTLELNISQAIEKVREAGSGGAISQDVADMIIDQLDTRAFSIRLIGNPNTVFSNEAISEIEAATGAEVTEIIRINVT